MKRQKLSTNTKNTNAQRLTNRDRKESCGGRNEKEQDGEKHNLSFDFGGNFQ